MDYKLFIPAAGTGSRLGESCRYLNKSLVSVGNRPGISHIIEKFPETIPVVVALGYKGSLVREFLTLAYPQRKFEFVEVSPFEGPGSGLGLSVLACREKLRCPFVFSSCDTIVDEDIPAPEENWMGFARVADATSFRTIKIREGRVETLMEKCAEGAEPNAYIGLAGIKDHEAFWAAMEKGDFPTVLAQGESFGLGRILAQKVKALPFRWHDTGSVAGLEAARARFTDENSPNILPKANEDIWFVGNSVIKFSADAKFIADRVTRSRSLAGFCPEVEGAGTYMYRYKRADGEVLSRAVTHANFEQLLKHAQNFWSVRSLSENEKKRFREVCFDFYKVKTYQRVAQFHQTFHVLDQSERINGMETPTTAELLAKVDWEWLSEGLPGNFHGDFHFENILFDEKTGRFVFLDWRQNFGGLMDVGDIYYDLAKLNHGLIVCHELVARDLFEVSVQEQNVRFEMLRKQSLVECERHFESFLRENGYDVRRMQILTALIYLNIAALHHDPYCRLLYYLGKSMLARLVAP